MSDRLELQREILAAINDPERLAEIAEREGIDPALWRYAMDLLANVRELEEEADA